MSSSPASRDDRPNLVARYLKELDDWLAEHRDGAILELGFDGQEAQVRTALARSARGAVQHAGGPPLAAGLDVVNTYGQAIADTELHRRARDVGAKVLEDLGTSRARHRARQTLELVAAAGIIDADYSEHDVNAVADVIRGDARERQA